LKAENNAGSHTIEAMANGVAAFRETHRCNHNHAPTPNTAENRAAFIPMSHGGIAKLLPESSQVAFISNRDNGRKTKSCMGGGSGTGNSKSDHATEWANSNTQTDTSSTPQDIQMRPIHTAQINTAMGYLENTDFLACGTYRNPISHSIQSTN
jgi:hypothetical protein